MRATPGLILILCIAAGVASANTEVLTTTEFSKRAPDLYQAATEAIASQSHAWDAAREHYKRNLGVDLQPRAIGARLVRNTDLPRYFVVVAAVGTDGEHSMEHSFLFEFRAPDTKLLVSDIPYYITDLWKTQGQELPSFSGEYVVSFCAVCDGPSVAEASSIVAIPVRGRIRGGQAKAAFLGGPYLKWILGEKLNSLFSAVPKPWPMLQARTDHARELLNAYNLRP